MIQRMVSRKMQYFQLEFSSTYAQGKSDLPKMSSSLTFLALQCSFRQGLISQRNLNSSQLAQGFKSQAAEVGIPLEGWAQNWQSAVLYWSNQSQEAQIQAGGYSMCVQAGKELAAAIFSDRSHTRGQQWGSELTRWK